MLKSWLAKLVKPRGVTIVGNGQESFGNYSLHNAGNDVSPLVDLSFYHDILKTSNLSLEGLSV